MNIYRCYLCNTDRAFCWRSSGYVASWINRSHLSPLTTYTSNQNLSKKKFHKFQWLVAMKRVYVCYCYVTNENGEILQHLHLIGCYDYLLARGYRLASCHPSTLVRNHWGTRDICPAETGDAPHRLVSTVTHVPHVYDMSITQQCSTHAKRKSVHVHKPVKEDERKTFYFEFR